MDITYTMKTLVNGFTEIRGIPKQMFNLDKTIESMQSLTWWKTPDGFWTGIIRGRVYKLAQEDILYNNYKHDLGNPKVLTRILTTATPHDWDAIMEDFFNLRNDEYERLYKATLTDSILRKTVESCYGLRVMAVPVWELILTQLVCNNQKSRQAVDRFYKFCKAFGQKLNTSCDKRFSKTEEYYKIPTLEELSKHDAADFEAVMPKALAKNLYKNINLIYKGFIDICNVADTPRTIQTDNFYELSDIGDRQLAKLCKSISFKKLTVQDKSDDKLMNQLKSLYGIADNTAKRIALYGYTRRNLVPDSDEVCRSVIRGLNSRAIPSYMKACINKSSIDLFRIYKYDAFMLYRYFEYCLFKYDKALI